MSKEYRSSAIIPLTPAADYSASKGYLGTFSGETFTVSASATVPATGAIIEGNDTAAGYANEKVAVGILGSLDGTIAMRAGGTIAKGARLQQNTDGTVVTDLGPGNARVVVGVACEAAVAGENFEVAPITPFIGA